jgi:hypothetical protein
MTIDTQKLRDGPYLRDGKETMRIMNEAADAIDAQAAEIARLRDGIEEAIRLLGMDRPINPTATLARALSGESHD